MLVESYITVPLTRFSRNTVFLRNKNARYTGTRCILLTDSSSKIGHDFRKQSGSKIGVTKKNVLTKNGLLNWYFQMKYKFSFLLKKLTLTVQFWHFLQNATFSLKSIHFFFDKIKLILDPPGLNKKTKLISIHMPDESTVCYTLVLNGSGTYFSKEKHWPPRTWSFKFLSFGDKQGSTNRKKAQKVFRQRLLSVRIVNSCPWISSCNWTILIFSFEGLVRLQANCQLEF